MKSKEDLEQYITTYSNDSYEQENLRTIENYYKKIINYSKLKKSILELGIGHGLNLNMLKGVFDKTTVIEGSNSLVLKYGDFDKNIKIIESYFEDFNVDDKFSVISMGFVLEHVEDPEKILIKYKEFLDEDGLIYVGVPNATSLHRIIGHNAGLLKDLKMMSDADYAFGHKRFLTNSEWLDMFTGIGFQVTKNEGLYLKPFTTTQLESLKLDNNIYNSMCGAAKDLPGISNSCFYELKRAT